MSQTPALNILIVDDEQVMHTLLTTFIEELGHHSKSAYTGEEAFEVIQKESFDLVLTDVRMPGMDGFELLEKVKEHTPNLPVVVITGHGDPEMSERATALGAYEFIIKPVSLVQFMGLIKKVAEEKNGS